MGKMKGLTILILLLLLCWLAPKFAEVVETQKAIEIIFEPTGSVRGAVGACDECNALFVNTVGNDSITGSLEVDGNVTTSCFVLSTGGAFCGNATSVWIQSQDGLSTLELPNL